MCRYSVQALCIPSLAAAAGLLAITLREGQRQSNDDNMTMRVLPLARFLRHSVQALRVTTLGPRLRFALRCLFGLPPARSSNLDPEEDCVCRAASSALGRPRNCLIPAVLTHRANIIITLHKMLNLGDNLVNAFYSSWFHDKQRKLR
jgi:hypothetical protein